MNPEHLEQTEALEQLGVLMSVGDIDLRSVQGQERYEEVLNARRNFCLLMGVAPEVLDKLSERQAIPGPARVAGSIAVLESLGLPATDIFEKYNRAMTFKSEKLQETADYLLHLGLDPRDVIPRHPRLLGYSVVSMERNVTGLEARGLSREFILKHHFVLGKTQAVHRLMDVLEANGMTPDSMLQQEPALLKRSPNQVEAVIKLVHESSPRAERIISQRPMIMTVGLNELQRRFSVIPEILGDTDMPGEIPDLLLHSSQVLQEGLSALMQAGMKPESRYIRYALRAGLRNVIAASEALRSSGARPSFDDILNHIAGSN